MTDAIEVIDRGVRLTFGFDDLMRHHGPHSPGGVAHAFRVMQRAFAVLAPEGSPERRAITIATAFAGPGARDAFELVTRAVTEDRYTVDPSLERPALGIAQERFVFVVGHGGRTVTLVVREGFVTDEFIALVRSERDEEGERRLTVMKREMADRVMAERAEDVYDVVDV